MNDYFFFSAPQLKRGPLGSVHIMPIGMVAAWVLAGSIGIGVTLWSARYRRDRHRPTSGFWDYDTWTLREFLSRETYDADKPYVATVVRAGLIASWVVFFGGVVLFWRL